MIIIVQHSKKLWSTGPVGWKFTGLRSKATAGHLEVVYMEGGRSYMYCTTRRILKGTTIFCSVYMQKFTPVWLPRWEGVEGGKQQYQTGNLGPSESALSTSLNTYTFQQQLVVLYNLTVLGDTKWNCQPCSDYRLDDPQPFLSGLSLALGSSKQKQFTWCYGVSSYLPQLGISQY